MASATEWITGRVVGVTNDKSLSSYLRRRRWDLLLETFPAIDSMRVLDIGGTAEAWRLCDVRPAAVTLLNVRDQEVEEPWMTAVRGDACEPPPELGDYDLVYSNSVIEHVGGHWRRERFAENILRTAPRYWVQTPYRYFPVEPHFLAPVAQFFPLRARSRLLATWPLGHARNVRTSTAVLPRAMGIELLCTTALSAYFPDARIHRERVAGLTKSLIAIGGA